MPFLRAAFRDFSACNRLWSPAGDMSLFAADIEIFYAADRASCKDFEACNTRMAAVATAGSQALLAEYAAW